MGVFILCKLAGILPYWGIAIEASKSHSDYRTVDILLDNGPLSEQPVDLWLPFYIFCL